MYSGGGNIQVIPPNAPRPELMLTHYTHKPLAPAQYYEQTLLQSNTNHNSTAMSCSFLTEGFPGNPGNKIYVSREILKQDNSKLCEFCILTVLVILVNH